MDDQGTDRTGGDDITPGWTFVGIVSDGYPIKLCGVNPWKFKWRDLDRQPIVVAHPQYPSQRHTMFRWEIVDGKKTIEFAAGEFSNCVWGFYVPTAENLDPTT